MIELDRVSAHRGGRMALQDVNMRLEPGTLTAVVGPNGGGKSTLLGLLSGRIRPTSGTVRREGAVAEVLQATTVDAQVRLTVHDVVCMGRYPTCGALRRFRPADRSAVDLALQHVDLLTHRRRTFDELSGGQRQRVLLAQGIAQDAPILLLDEPSAGLDSRSQRQVMDVIRRQADAGRTVVIVTHDLAEAATADLVVALSCTCICCAAPSEAFSTPSFRALFDPLQGLRPGGIGQTTITTPDGGTVNEARQPHPPSTIPHHCHAE